jgi:hypothetical protein
MKRRKAEIRIRQKEHGKAGDGARMSENYIIKSFT